MAAAPAANESAAKTPALGKRAPWTTSHFHGRPDPPPPFRPVSIYPQLKFDKTTVLAVEPGSNRFFVGQRDGKIFVLPEDRQATEAPLFLDVSAMVKRLQLQSSVPLAFDSLYGLTFDPEFAQNRYCYVCYVVRPSDRQAPQLPEGTRVVRYKVSAGDPPRAELDSEELVIAWLHGGHNGGCLKFGPDGYLYISSGDGGVAFPPDGLNSGQDLSRLLSKVLRIDVHRSEQGRPYAIPADNPFASVGGARGETWSYGMRNPWKMSFDRQTGQLWVGDVGWELWELVYKVQKGDNYGWSIVEGSQQVHTERQRGPTPIVPPWMEIPHTEGASITGGYVYRGRQFPELQGHYIFGDWETRRIWSVPAESQAVVERSELIDPIVRIVDFAEDREGELYLLDHEDGAIYGLTRNEAVNAPNTFPRTLSDTGLFQTVATQQPAEGVLPFSVNVDHWCDGATAQRWIAVPGTETIQLHARPQLIPGSQFSRATDYPRETVLVKTLSLELEAGNPASRRRIETQTLHYDGREWLGYTYQWNDQQTEATLVDKAGATRSLQIVDSQAPGGRRSYTWRFASRHECLRCHNPWSEYALAFNVPQLNRGHDFGGIEVNQIEAFRRIGLLTDVLDEPEASDPALAGQPPKSPDELPRLVPPHDSAFSLDRRARSYLHVHCSHCHRFNGGGSSYIYLQHDLSLVDTKAIGVRPTQGTFGIHDAQLLAPGDPYRSVLYFRFTKTGPGHMPHLGSRLIDPQAVPLLHDWIRQLPVRVEDAAKIDRLIALHEPTALAQEAQEAPQKIWAAARRLARAQQREKPNEQDLATARGQVAQQAVEAVPARAKERAQLTAELLSTASRASLLAEAVRLERLPPPVRALVMEQALSSQVDQAIRDLFEAFIPEDQQTVRLGESIRPEAILSLSGDPERGRLLFHESTVVQCRSCHRIAAQGTAVGPDLDSIGKKLDRSKLLTSILQPSLEVDPKYTVWLVETSAGTVLTGLLVQRDAEQVVLRDAQNKTHRVATADVEGIFAQTKSLMPEMQFRDFTAQQAADLLAYLSTLRAEVPPPAPPLPAQPSPPQPRPEKTP